MRIVQTVYDLEPYAGCFLVSFCHFGASIINDRLSEALVRIALTLLYR